MYFIGTLNKHSKHFTLVIYKKGLKIILLRHTHKQNRLYNKSGSDLCLLTRSPHASRSPSAPSAISAKACLCTKSPGPNIQCLSLRFCGIPPLRSAPLPYRITHHSTGNDLSVLTSC